MGWSFACDTRHDRKACVASLTGPGAYSSGYTLLRHQQVGNHLWTLIKCPDERIIIGLHLLQGGGRTMGWGHKDMDEESGPTARDCPLSFLDAASEPRGYAINWRNEVRAYHAAKKARPTLVAGLVVGYCGHQYRLDSPVGPRRGWRVTRVSDGAVFRMNSKQFSHSKVI